MHDISWPEALVYIASLLAICFVIRAIMRGM